MTLSHQQLFVINDCFETQPQTHILCCHWVVDHYISLMNFPFWKVKTNQSFLLLATVFFHNFSLTTLVTHSKFHVDDKKLLMRKSCQLHFALSVDSLTLSHNCQEKFSSQWGLLKNWWNGARRLLTVEKRMHQLFKQQILLPLYHWHACRIILPARPIIVPKVLVRTLVFCFIGFIRSKCRPIEWN